MGCKATTKSGNPCKAAPLTDSDFCLAHADEATRTKTGFGSKDAAAQGGRNRRKPRAIEVLRERIEADVDEVLAPIFAALDATDSNGGPDWRARLAAARELLDRGYGKPSQTTEISGPDGAPIDFTGLPQSQDWHQAVAAVLNETGAHGADPDQDQ